MGLPTQYILQEPSGACLVVDRLLHFHKKRGCYECVDFKVRGVYAAPFTQLTTERQRMHFALACRDVALGNRRQATVRGYRGRRVCVKRDGGGGLHVGVGGVWFRCTPSKLHLLYSMLV